MSKTAYITGASAGIGKCFVESYIKKGFKVIGLDRDEKGLLSLKETHQGKFDFITVDLLELSDFSKFVAEAFAKYGLPNLWINNAGMIKMGAFQDISDDFLSIVMKLNFEVMAKFCNNIIPLMEKEREGVIVNIASVAGHVSCPFMSSYAASKHAVVGYTKSIQDELSMKHSPVKLLLVSPGFINSTSLFKKEKLGVFQAGFDMLSTTAPKAVERIIKSIDKKEEYITPTLNGNMILKMNWLSPGLGKLFSRVATSKNYKQALGIEKIDSL